MQPTFYEDAKVKHKSDRCYHYCKWKLYSKYLTVFLVSLSHHLYLHLPHLPFVTAPKQLHTKQCLPGINLCIHITKISTCLLVFLVTQKTKDINSAAVD